MQQVPVLQSTTVAAAEGRLRRSLPSLPAVKPDRLKAAKTLAGKAMKLGKVFSVQGPYPVIRAALWARGWVERRLPPRPALRVEPRCPGEEEEEDEDGADGYINDVTVRVDQGEEEENLDDMYGLMSRLVRNEMPHFFWTTRRDYIDCRSLRSDQMTNHYANAGTFTTKVGLCVNLRNLQWFDAADSDTFFPRCYRLGAEDERHAFIEDFRRTACTSLLLHVVETNRQRRDGAEGQKASDESNHAERQCVGAGMIDTALRVCGEFLSVLEHDDIDAPAEESTRSVEQRWAEFLQDYYLVVHRGARISGSGALVKRCQAMLSRLQEVCPQLDTDGLNNIWIIKPGAKSRGRGIMCLDRLEDILALVDNDRAVAKESKWVVQKYLERPLLIHGTKFDLRQWFLVTDWNPLTVWFYGECYIRFSTQPYSTDTLDSSVHLCNNSIQKHLRPSRERHPGLPQDNMWSCSQLRAHLQQQRTGVRGGADWDSVVVPGMRTAVVRALLTSQDLVEPRRASFELYGADFMLGPDLRPWLLEVNASPTMACSSAATARLCPAVQLDTLRVVLDRRSDPSAYTGGFQLIYKQAAVEVPQYVGVNLLVEGAPVRRSRPVHHHRQTAVPNPPLLPALLPPPHLTGGEVEGTTTRPAGHCSRKENRAVGEKNKRQATGSSPGSEADGGTEVENASCVRRSGCGRVAPERTLATRNQPRRKASKHSGLGFGAKGSTLVPRSLSFSLGPPPRGTPDCRHQPKQSHGSHGSKSFLPQAALEPRQRTSTSAGVFPSLPTLEVFSLRPNIVAAGSTARHGPTSQPTRVHRHQWYLRSRRHSMAKCKAEGTGEHKQQW